MGQGTDVGDLGRRDDGGKRKAVANALRHCHDVGHDALRRRRQTHHYWKCPELQARLRLPITTLQALQPPA